MLTAGPLVAINSILPMKEILFSILIILLANSQIYSQENDSTDIIIDYIEEMPMFPGGLDSIWCFLESNYRFDKLNSDSESVSYVIKFVIDTSGKAIDFKFIGTIPKDKINLNDSPKKMEILRVLELMPRWEPARQNSKKVPCSFVLQINTPVYFRCKSFQVDEKIEAQPDRLAKFNWDGKTNQERIDNFVYKNLRWIQEPECYGKIVIKCVVEKNGKLSNFQFLRKLCPEQDHEAVRVLKEMPRWEPALKDGKPVRSYVVIPFVYRLK
jgi:hypothetical protein